MDVENPMQIDIPVATLVRLEVIGEPFEEPKTIHICAEKICNCLKILCSALVIICVMGGILLYVLVI